MGKASKRMRGLREKASGKELSVGEAIVAVKGGATAKFDESVEVAIRLGVDTRKSDQAVRGVAVMPSGTGRETKVAALCEGEKINDAIKAGADFAGAVDVLAMVEKGDLSFDVLIAEPAVMSKLAKHGKVLGPKGLMPNPKDGTVTNDIGKAVAQAKAGQVSYRAERGGIVHAAIGKVSFDDDALAENFKALVDSVKRAKPAAAKGQYLVNASMASTMGAGVGVDLGPLR